MSKGQRGNKEAKKPKRPPAPPVEAAGALPLLSPAPKARPKSR